MTVRDALARAAATLHALPSARRDAELLLMRALSKDRAWLLTHSEEAIDAERLLTFESWIERRSRHEPVQYILGEQEFFGMVFHVTRDVLIPRPETEHLVEAGLALLPADAALRIADVGTGSGAIAVALADARPLAKIVALDISPGALRVAAGNAATHGVADRIEFRESDLLDAAAGEVFDLIVSNPPYVPAGEELEVQVRDHEPASALYAGPMGLDIYLRLIPQAACALKPGGWLLMEIGHGQREALLSLLEGWGSVSFVDDLQGIPRVVCAQRPAA